MGWHYHGPDTTLPDPDAVRASAAIEREHNSDPTTFPGTSHDFSQKAQVLVFDTNGPAINATPEFANGHIIIDLAGVYSLTVHIGMLGGNQTVYSLAIFKNNGAVQVVPRTTRKVGAAADEGAASVGGLAQLDVGDTIELWVQNETNTNDFIVHDVSLYIHRI
jgi:hypothetical protein